VAFTAGISGGSVGDANASKRWVFRLLLVLQLFLSFETRVSWWVKGVTGVLNCCSYMTASVAFAATECFDFDSKNSPSDPRSLKNERTLLRR